ncbi:unnamed protein product, partial [Discosporangium mesarthrocarpum]
ILPRKVLVFRASNVLKNRINGEAGGEDDADDGFSDAEDSSVPAQQPDTPPPLGGGTPFRPGS